MDTFGLVPHTHCVEDMNMKILTQFKTVIILAVLGFGAWMLLHLATGAIQRATAALR